MGEGFKAGVAACFWLAVAMGWIWIIACLVEKVGLGCE